MFTIAIAPDPAQLEQRFDRFSGLEERPTMKMRDLPVETFDKTWNRRVYALLWAPFDGVLSVFGRGARYARIAFVLALVLWIVAVVAMALLGYFTMPVVLGMGGYALLGGAGLTVVMLAMDGVSRLFGS